MDFVAGIAQGGIVTVLHEGSVLAQGTMDEVQADAPWTAGGVEGHRA